MQREFITSKHNPLLTHVKKLLASRSYREKTGQFAADGTKLLEEATKWYPGLRTVLVQQDVAVCALPDHVRVVEIPVQLMRDVSQMEAPQGAIFVCDLPVEPKTPLVPGTLLLDGIQDPGNLGTILRTADALGVPVVLLDGCADPYNPKTVRASMGAVLRTIPHRMARAEAIESCCSAGIPLLATAMSADAKDLRTVDLPAAAVIIGSEGRGVCQELFDAADGKIIIPMQERCESLNAAIAATIVMWQMQQSYR